MATDFIKNIRKKAKDIGVDLTIAQAGAFMAYEDLLARANKKINLTALPKERYIDEHFIDSLTLLQAGKIKDGSQVADIGAGAGFPGVPIKIVVPDIEMNLIEANAKKAVFLRFIVDELGLEQTNVIQQRAEEAARKASLREKMDVVVARAVVSLPVLLEYALPLCKVGGWFLAMKGPKLEKEIEPSQKSAVRLGGQIDSIIKPFGRSADIMRTIVLIQKHQQTALSYPRRPGIPAKRPLGG